MFASVELHSIVLLIYVCLLMWAAITDIQSMQIPNVIVLSLLILYPAHVLSSPADVAVEWSLVAAGIMFAAGFLVFCFGAMGGGDVKLLVAVVLWSGLSNFMTIMLVTVIGGVCLVPLSGFMMSLKVARQEAEKNVKHSGGAGVLHGARILGAAIAGMRYVPLKQHWIPYGVAISAAGIYVAGTSLMSAA